MDNRDQIDAIKEALDIVAIINGYVPSLKRSGRNYFGLCPFHKEKTPSFSVNPDLKLFKCFGCGEGGDVIKFISRIEGLEFPKALQLAADKAGIVLKRSFNPESDKIAKEKKRLLEANELTAKYYNYLLLSHKLGEPGRAYVKKRKLREQELKKFLIGYAPNGFNNLKNFLLKRGFSLTELISWGLLVEKNGKIYDKFRNRLMFTIVDHQGDVVGFSGRLIDPEGLGPKYLNSPETIVYKKSKTLFGLYHAKDSMRKESFVVLVEGNVDILSSHKVGIENIVAPLGTALTIDQVKLIKRYCDSIYFALDTDSAGQKALERDLPLIDQAQLKAFVLDLGKYKDVDELIVAGEDWPSVATKPIEVVPYFIDSLKDKYDFSKAFSKTEYIRKILGFISKTNDVLLQNDYLHRLQGVTAVDARVLKNELEKIIKNQKQGTLEDVKNQDEIENPRTKEKEVLSKYLLSLVYQHVNFKSKIKEMADYADLLENKYLVVFRGILDSNLTQKFSLSDQELYEEALMSPVNIFEDFEKFKKELSQVINRIKKENIKERLETLRLKTQDGKGNESLVELQKLAKELAEIDLVKY